jgi:8-oxo-dGTP pyrophosphatase MutT (NUDIX family)
VKTRSAIVLVTRGDLVLALTRHGVLHDLHLPGGKVEPRDGGDPRVTAARELAEETGLRIAAGDLRHVLDLVSSSGRPVSAFATVAPLHAPDRFGMIGCEWVAWVPPGALVQPWCSLREVGGAVLEAACVELEPGTAHAECPDCGRWLLCEEESGGLRLPVHRSHPEAPRSLSLCSGSVAWLDDEGTPRIDVVTIAALNEFAGEVREAAHLAGALRDLGSRGRGVDAGARR